MKITKATRKFEEWLGERLPLIQADLDYKHEQMSEGLFEFMRATFYRWAQLWPEFCPDLAKAPSVLAVGDLHTSNFGTWRDVEGRLVWGINDFDEAHPLPYAADLVRLAMSAIIEFSENHDLSDLDGICESLLDGYDACLRDRGQPFILAGKHGWLSELASNSSSETNRFWRKLSELPKTDLPESAKRAIELALPEAGMAYRTSHRVAGLGSLGRQRFVALGDLAGDPSAREAKPLTLSAVAWAGGDVDAEEIWYSKILRKSVRSRDPFLQVHDEWLVRRLSPDYRQIQVSLVGSDDVGRLLHAMGYETANVHLGSPDSIKDVRKDLRDRNKDDEGWLRKAVEAMLERTTKDWEYWLSEHSA